MSFPIRHVALTLTALASVAAFTGGCDDAETTTPSGADANPRTGDVGGAAENIEAVGQDAANALENAGDKAGDAVGDAAQATENAAERAGNNLEAAGDRAATDANAAGANMGAAAGDVTQRAEAMFTQARTAIEQKNFPVARGIVDQLKGMRAQLPANLQTRVDELERQLTDAQK